MSKFVYSKINFFSNHLFFLLGLFIPISVAITNIIIGLISFFWLIEGNFKLKYDTIKASKWMISLFLLIGIYILGNLWGTNHVHSAWQFQRLLLLLFFPILLTFKIDQKAIKNGLIAFLISTFISACLAILINCNVIYPLSEYLFFLSENHTISAFLKYNYHNLLLTFSCLICIYLVVEKKTKNKKTLLFFISIYILSIFTESGRAGQLLFNFLSISYIFYYAKKHSYKWYLLLFILVIFQVGIYKTTTVFKNRFDTVLSVVTNKGLHLNHNKKDVRYIFFNETLKKIHKNPVLGYGSGSFGTIFKNEVKAGYDFSLHKTPHNQYLYVWFEIGITGLFLLLMMFFFQIKEMYNKKDGFHRSLLPISFMLLMLIDSYLFIFTIMIGYIFLYKIFCYQESE